MVSEPIIKVYEKLVLITKQNMSTHYLMSVQLF